MIVATTTSRLSTRRTVGWFLLLVATVAITATLLARSGAAGSGGYPIDALVASHHLTAAQVETVVLDRLTAMGTAVGAAQISHMTVLPMSMLPTIEPGAGAPAPGSAEAGQVVWLVRASGRFVGMRVPPGAAPITASSGYFLVDDATGQTLGMGMP
jgi:hypothetical protein